MSTNIEWRTKGLSFPNTTKFTPEKSLGVKLESIHNRVAINESLSEEFFCETDNIVEITEFENPEKSKFKTEGFEFAEPKKFIVEDSVDLKIGSYTKDSTGDRCSLDRVKASNTVDEANFKIGYDFNLKRKTKTAIVNETSIKQLTAKKAEVNLNGILEEAKTQDLNLLANEVVSKNYFIHHDDVLYMFNGSYYSKISEKAMMLYLRKDLAKYSQYFKKSDYWEMYNNITIHPDVQVDKLPSPSENLVSFRNGVLDVKDNMLIGHSPHHNFFSTLNVDYVDETYVNNGVFDHFIHTASCGDNQVRTQVLELIVLIILGYQVKAFFVIVGPTGSGKSQFGRFLSELFGHEAVTSINSVSDFSKNFGLSQIQKKKLVMCMDLPDDNLPKSAIGIMKQFVGDDMLNINIKYKNSQTIYEKPILLCASNHAIKLSSKDKAVEERMVLIPFIGTPEVKVPKLYEKLVLEAPYIVKEAFKTLRGLKQRAYEPTRAYVPAEYAFGGGNNSERCIAEFIQMHIVEDRGSKITTEDIYASFNTMNSEISYIDFSRIFKQSVLKFCPQAVYKRNLINGTKSGYLGLKLDY